LLLLALLASAAVPRATASVGGVTPLQKVVQLLDGMLAKGKAEKHAEEVEFAKFQAWCDGTRKSTTKSIEAASDQLVQLSADIAKAESDAEVLSGEISGLEKEIANATGEAASAKAVREKENTDYLAQHQDFSESIDALERAIAVLKSRRADVPQSLVQVQRSEAVPAKAKALLQAFAAESSGRRGGQAPEANAYEFQGGSVVEMLEKLRIRFKDELFALQKAEINAKSNFQMLLQQLENNLKADNAAVSQKTAAKADRLSDAAGWKGDAASVSTAKAGDEKTLSDTSATCRAQSEEFEQNQVTRAEEVKSIKKAIEILTSDSVKGHAETHLPTLLQSKRKPSALAQLRSAGSQRDEDVRHKASAYLQSRASALGSRYLSVMAEHLKEDPFGKVKSMIKDLIVKLMEEANEEADHHAYCTAELATNKMTREDKSQEAEKLSAEVDQLTAKVAQLADEITELSDAMSELQGSRADATKLRAEEKKTNAQTTADATEAQVAVQKAIEVLRSFYDKDAAGDSSLLQAGAKGKEKAEANATRAEKQSSKRRGREPYTGMASDSTGVMGLLDVILSDFARLEAETSSAEDQAAAAYQKYMDESAQELAVKGTTSDHKEGSKQQAEESLRSTKKELSLTQEELDAALVYYDKLKADCVDTNLSYEDRRKMRQEEIQSLKEALRILNGEDSLV